MRLPYTKTSIIFADSTSHQCSPGRKRKVPRPVFISVNLHGPTKGPCAFDEHLPLGDAIFPRYPVRQIGERLQARPRSIEHEVRKGAAAGFACRRPLRGFALSPADLSTPQLGSDYLLYVRNDRHRHATLAPARNVRPRPAQWSSSEPLTSFHSSSDLPLLLVSLACASAGEESSSITVVLDPAELLWTEVSGMEGS
jgi:hypothetical protein